MVGVSLRHQPITTTYPPPPPPPSHMQTRDCRVTGPSPPAAHHHQWPITTLHPLACKHERAVSPTHHHHLLTAHHLSPPPSLARNCESDVTAAPPPHLCSHRESIVMWHPATSRPLATHPQLPPCAGGASLLSNRAISCTNARRCILLLLLFRM
jgi:hypothetical protein